MIRSIAAENFLFAPHLEGTMLMKSHGGLLAFNADKPNIIVGPNGSGKSTVINALSVHTLSDLTGVSRLCDRLIRYSDEYWLGAERFSYDVKHLSGLIIDSDLPAAMYYRPHHIPGNESDLATAMVTGYANESRNYREKTKNKSSGQQCSALLEDVMNVIRGDTDVPKLMVRESFKQHLQDMHEGVSIYRMGQMERRAVLLYEKYITGAIEGAIPVVLMDEPEQSLDTINEIKFWKEVMAADVSNKQIIIATHSLYPFLNPQGFNIIEAVPGYFESVLEAIK